MELTVKHILDLISELDSGKEYSYVSGSDKRVKIGQIKRPAGPVKLIKTGTDFQNTTTSFSAGQLEIVAGQVKENRPFSIEKIFNGSSSNRSTIEAVLANTAEFYSCKIDKKKHLIWMPQKRHETGVICEIPVEELEFPVEEAPVSVKDRFRSYMSGVMQYKPKTVDTYTSTIEGKLSEEVRQKIFPDLHSLFDVTDEERVRKIMETLFSFPSMKELDQKGNTMYSSALKCYIRFLQAVNKEKEENMSVKPEISIETYPLTYSDPYRKYFTAIQTKPFVLLAGISGTGKSRIVRELARRTCCLAELQNRQKPGNYEIIQVRPNWHDSTELMGYVSRIGDGGPCYVVTPFLQFLAKAWYFKEVPFFLCLDEMNLAPVEQYFAEYLSVIETRRLTDGEIITDPLLSKGCDKKVFTKLVEELLAQEEMKDEGRVAKLRDRFLEEGISIPSNLIVMGTVNMDETTHSFSRKVLDRAMTIEMNEVDLSKEFKEPDSVPENTLVNPGDVIGKYAEGKDVYAGNQQLCNQILDYLERINGALDKTPFKIAYRTRNEFMIYGVTNAALNQGSAEQYTTWLDEMTAMKILSRIEGENEIVRGVLEKLSAIVPKNGVSDGKIEEMKERGKVSGYISYWA